MDIGQRIKSRREQLGLSQDELAKKIGYKHKSSINKIETGILSLRQSKIAAIAEALETTPSYIMGWSDGSDESQTKTNTDSLPDNAAAVLDSVRDAFGDKPAEALDMFTRFNDEGQDKILDHMKDLAEVSRYTEKDGQESRLA